MSDALSTLDKRITALELKVHNQSARELGKSKPISDQILLINKLLNSKVPTIHKTNELIPKLIQISKIYPENYLVNDKINVILSYENQMRSLIEMIRQVKEKQASVDGKNYKPMIEYNKVMNKLTADQLSMFEDVQSQTESVSELMKQYTEIVNNITQSLVMFNNTIDMFQEAHK